MVNVPSNGSSGKIPLSGLSSCTLSHHSSSLGCMLVDRSIAQLVQRLIMRFLVHRVQSWWFLHERYLRCRGLFRHWMLPWPSSQWLIQPCLAMQLVPHPSRFNCRKSMQFLSMMFLRFPKTLQICFCQLDLHLIIVFAIESWPVADRCKVVSRYMAFISMRWETCPRHTARVRVQIERCPNRGAYGLLPPHRIKKVKRDVFKAILREFLHPRFNSGPSTEQRKRRSSPSRVSLFLHELILF